MSANTKQELPQLFMRNKDITKLPPLCLPKGGMSLHTHTEGEEENWERLIEKAFGTHYSFDDFIRNTCNKRKKRQPDNNAHHL